MLAAYLEPDAQAGAIADALAAELAAMANGFRGGWVGRRLRSSARHRCPRWRRPVIPDVLSRREAALKYAHRALLAPGRDDHRAGPPGLESFGTASVIFVGAARVASLYTAANSSLGAVTSTSVGIAAECSLGAAHRLLSARPGNGQFAPRNRRKPWRPLPMHHGAGHRCVVHLDPRSRAPKHQAAAAHVPSSHENGREAKSLAENRQQDLGVLSRS